MRTCSTEGCNNKHRAKGLCKNCYTMQWFKSARASNSDKIKQYNQDKREYYYKNRNKLAKVAKRYRTENKEAIRERRREQGKDLHVQYMSNKRIARHDKRKWELTEEQFKELRSKPCEYCGQPYTVNGVGLDRVDSSKHYCIDNVVPCCKVCNTMKSVLSVDEFKQHIVRIYENFQRKDKDPK